MIQKPKHKIPELRKKLKQKYVRSSTIEKHVAKYKEKSKLYTVQQREKRTVKKQQKALFERTKEKVKGKSKSVGSQIWSDYQIKKESIKLKHTPDLLFRNYDLKESASYKYEKTITHTTSWEKHFELKGDIDTAINILYQSEIRGRTPQPHFIMVTLEGKSTYQQKNDLPKAYFTDSFDLERFEQEFLNDPDESMLEIIRLNTSSRESGENFEIYNVYIRLIYAENTKT